METVKDRLKDMETLRMKSNKGLKWVPKMRVEWIGDRQYWRNDREFSELRKYIMPRSKKKKKKPTVNSGRNLQ